ncbi:MAG: hypothetical protein WC181_07940 [Defluviitoga sp.]
MKKVLVIVIMMLLLSVGTITFGGDDKNTVKKAFSSFFIYSYL